jgi:hypothetical protein
LLAELFARKTTLFINYLLTFGIICVILLSVVIDIGPAPEQKIIRLEKEQSRSKRRAEHHSPPFLTG